jgi:hypothetical protein
LHGSNTGVVGSTATGTVTTMALVVADMTETVLEFSCAMYMSPLRVSKTGVPRSPTTEKFPMRPIAVALKETLETLPGQMVDVTVSTESDVTLSVEVDVTVKVVVPVTVIVFVASSEGAMSTADAIRPAAIIAAAATYA